MRVIDLVRDLRPVILAARQLPFENNRLEQFLPATPVQAITYKLGRKKKFDETVPVRAFGSPATPIRRPGLGTVQGELPAVTPIVNLTETDLNAEFILAQQLNGQQVDYTPWVVEGAGLVAKATHNTYELLRGQLLSTAELSLTVENGDTYGVDFEVPDAQKIAVGAPPAAGVAFFDELEAAHDVFINVSGASAGVALTTRAVYRRALQAIQTLYPQSPAGAQALNAYLVDRGLPEFMTYDRSLATVDAAGNETRQRVYPEGHLTFLPEGGTVGRTLMGITQEAVQQVQNQVLAPTEAPGMTIQTLGQDNPVERAVKGASVGLPVIDDTNDIVIVSGLV